MPEIFFWSFLALASTLLGSWLLLFKQEWSKLNTWRILAFVSGILLSVSFVHLLPEANTLSSGFTSLGVLAAFFFLFSLEEFAMMHSCTEYLEECPIHIVGWTAFSALFLHSLLDGLAISIAFNKDAFLGQMVASAILVHKFTDGLSLTGLLLAANYSAKKCFRTVLILSLATPIGALLAAPIFADISVGWMAGLLGFVSGSFFYIGASDIIPRLHKNKDIFSLFTFACGLGFGGIRWR